tara:strand:- start:104 stop:412 length:309 start_codon:yes stop_codon:yes gene_type:complete
MAIGDAVAAFMGAAGTNRQPSSGVEEKITAVTKQQTTDSIAIYDGSNERDIVAAGATVSNTDATASQHSGAHNMAYMITNSVYLRKGGSTDIVSVHGVQTNA